MAVLLGIAILAVVIFWMNRTGQIGPPGSGARVSRKETKSCDWQRVNPDETRMLKEYRCSACGEVAYGRGENPPAARPCRAG